MKRTLYDALGHAIAYIAEDGERTICLWNGTPVAYIDDWLNCYGWNGTCLGWIEKGILHDTQGQAVGFMKSVHARVLRAEPSHGPRPLKSRKAAKRPPCDRPEGRSGICPTPLEDFLRAGAVEAPNGHGELVIG